MDKFPVYLLRQLLNCMQDGLSIRVTAQKLGISKSSVSFLSQTALSHSGSAKVAELIQLPNKQSYWKLFTRRQRRRTKNQTG